MPSVMASSSEMFRVTVPTIDTELVGGSDRVLVPGGISDFESFRAWTRSADFPAGARIDYLDGEIWLDLSMEQLYTHNQLKLEIYLALAEIVRQSNSGIVVADRMRFSYPGAESSVEPDGAFVSFEALREKRVRQLGARAGSVTELEGAPEMVLEIVSDSSEEKDADKLPTYYAQAGVREFWPADVRTGIRFEIYHLGGTGYQAAAEPDGWQRSDVFDRSFRLSRNVDAVGMPRFRLEAR